MLRACGKITSEFISCKRSCTVVRLLSNTYATNPNVSIEPDASPAYSVFLSQSNDIFTNLALENWLYKNFNFSKHRILFLWRNSPCVVIGRHQNPWVEADTGLLNSLDIPLARRNSGGGTVYHDLGNINCTFFTPRDKYDRKHNLEIIKETLSRGWDLPVQLSPREDLILNDEYKISGTAAKLGGKNAYHHCTILVDVETYVLRDVLHSKLKGVNSRATTSVPAMVKNLSSFEPSVSVESVLVAVGHRFLGQAGHLLNRGFQMINPSEGWFPGINAMKEELESWQWIYGKTPKFTQDIKVSSAPDMLATLTVEKGVIESVAVPQGCPKSAADKVQSLVGSRFSESHESQIKDVQVGGKKVRRTASKQTATMTAL